MKSKLYLVVMIVAMAALSFTMTSCDLDFFGGTGTVIVQNVSNYAVDNPVYVDISRANNSDNVLIHQYNVGISQQVTFTGVPAGISYKVWVGESNGSGDFYESAAFTLTTGQTITFKYNGHNVTR